MRIRLDGVEIDVPGATTLGELLDGMRPHIDPERLVTVIEVDDTTADPSDNLALAAWRLGGQERVCIGTEAPSDFAGARRSEIVGHLERISALIGAAAHGFSTGLTTDANRVLAAAARELVLVLELDQNLADLEGRTPDCATLAAALEQVGPQLAEAEEGRRWTDLARLLADEVLPALAAGTGQGSDARASAAPTRS